MIFKSSWRSPSNIALIKYWGKHGIQLPRNPSLSFTLSACHTDMNVTVETNQSQTTLTILYHGEPRPSFKPKIESFLNRIVEFFPWIRTSSITIDSINTFPYGAGIASSASAMSALALCLLDINNLLQSNDTENPNSQLTTHNSQSASRIARLGSGSAARSIFPECSIWGKSESVANSHDEYAIGWGHELSQVFKTYQDTILIVSAGEKSVSSSMGHEMMTTLAYADARYQQANKNFNQIIEELHKTEVTENFISIVESEALQLHALMMSGEKPFTLLEPDTLSMIKEIWRFRKESGIPVCFTLDAGPNVHLLYPLEHKTDILGWMQESLIPYCADGVFIMDEVGKGPTRLTENI